MPKCEFGKNDNYKRSKEITVKGKIDIEVADLNLDKKLRQTIDIEVTNLILENEKIRQTIQVVDGKADELVKLLTTMQSLITSTEAAFVLPSIAISELTTSVNTVDVKVAVAQHAGHIAAEEIALLQQIVDENFGAISELRTALKKMYVKIGLVQHAGDTVADKFALTKQKVDEKFGNADAKMKTTVQSF